MDNPIILTAAGLVVGFLVGMTGMGCGALMTPFLILVMKINPILAVGTDLAFAAITKFVGGFQHWRQETVWLRPVMWMAVGSLPASFLGSRFLIRNAENEHIIREVMPTILGIVLLNVGVVIIVRTSGILKTSSTSGLRYPYPWALILIGAVGGFLVGITSIGGGTVIMALLVILFAIPPEQLVGLDVAHGAVLALFTASTYALNGKTDWNMVVWLVLGSLPGVWIGAKAVKVISEDVVRIVLGCLLILAGINMFLE